MDGQYAVFAGAKNCRTQAKRCETSLKTKPTLKKLNQSFIRTFIQKVSKNFLPLPLAHPPQ